MRLRAATASALMVAAGAALPLLARQPILARHQTEVGDWRLDVSRDLFSGEVACRLRARNGSALFRSGAVGFRFRSRWDVGQAIYRVDGEPPRAWRDDLPELIRLAVPIETGGLDNPSDGIVWIPFRALADANTVAIQPRPDHRAFTFHFRGFRGLLEVARARGCVPDGRFGP